MTVGNDRRDPNMVTFNKDLAYEFLRHLIGKDLDVRKYLEDSFDLIDNTPMTFLMAGIAAVTLDDDIKVSDVYKGFLMGVGLSVAASKTGPKTLEAFMETYKKKGQNVADIADAFKKRAERV